MQEQKTILKGIPASPGLAEGEVKIILDPKECGKLKRGDILITEMTTPLYTTAIMKAKAIVTDIGGLLSHAAIVARENRIPCIVGTEKATKALKDGQRIIVDGTEGKVYETE